MHNFEDHFLCFDREVEYVVAALGILGTGSAYLPMYRNLAEERRQWYLEDSGAQCLITSHSNHYLVQTIFDGHVIYIEDIEDIAPSFHGTVDAHQIPPLQDWPRGNNRDLAYMIYTSGTTGNPKGVEVEHRGVLNMLHHHRHRLHIGENHELDKAVIVANFIFDSSIRETWLPLVYGGCLCITAQAGLPILSEGTMCAGTPSALTACM